MSVCNTMIFESLDVEKVQVCAVAGISLGCKNQVRIQRSSGQGQGQRFRFRFSKV